MPVSLTSNDEPISAFYSFDSIYLGLHAQGRMRDTPISQPDDAMRIPYRDYYGAFYMHGRHFAHDDFRKYFNTCSLFYCRE
jgi:hypothetical protein